ncbi:hypothetical protein OU800_22170 [Pseudomonas sp. GOM7]|uniref:hypothetical protein n=1 Tax=Pseudomonas sp. GOM7 TaxID=2998079 RepID=UPI00227BEE23|nr:hypothetical protein [Pseudomonas sp. GOM7]WAJ37282.1 hypothetical protein OU800_22170 [Pseudomonas sp. GOM7]
MSRTHKFGPLSVTPAEARILSLPVVFTPEAWHEAVHIEACQPSIDLDERLSTTLMAAYLAVLASPSVAVVDFGLHRLPPDGDKRKPLWLDLQVSHGELSQSTQLLISLKQDHGQLAA